MSPRLWWYIARSSGLVAWVLVTASVLWGLALSTRLTRRPKPAWVLDLHRFLGGLSVVFVGVHVAGLVADSYTHFGPSDVLVPFASAWHPTAVAGGVVALYLLAAVELTSLAMRYLPRRFWHAVHLTSFGIFGLTTVHALTAGTDTSSPAARWFALGSTAMVVFLTMVRVLSPRGARPARHQPARVPTTTTGLGLSRTTPVATLPSATRRSPARP